MTKEDKEPIERQEEEPFFHPADKTTHPLHDREVQQKKELADERQELAALLNKLPNPPPKKGESGYEAYLQIQQQIQGLKNRISKTHDELMEILKNEEAINREINKKDN